MSTQEPLSIWVSAHWACVRFTLYHNLGTFMMNLVGARKNHKSTVKNILQTDTAFIMARVWPALVISLIVFVETDIAHITVK